MEQIQGDSVPLYVSNILRAFSEIKLIAHAGDRPGLELTRLVSGLQAGSQQKG